MKKAGIFLGVALFCLAGYLVYLFEFKTYHVADAKVDVIAEEEYVIVLSDGSKIVLDGNGNLVRREQPFSSSEDEPAVVTPIFSVDKPDSDSASNKKVPEPESKVTTVANKKASPPKKTNSLSTPKKSNQIKEQYEAAFAALEEQSTDRLYKMVSLAKNEYLEKQANGQTISYPYFYNKYTSAASELEKQTDEFFYALIAQMKQDLKANGLPQSTTETYVQEYEKRKDKLRNQLLKNAADL